jgi:hypothetical protein
LAPSGRDIERDQIAYFRDMIAEMLAGAFADAVK